MIRLQTHLQTFSPGNNLVRWEEELPVVSCPALLLPTSSLAGTPSPGPPRLKKTPAAVRPLPQGGEGQGSDGVLRRSHATAFFPTIGRSGRGGGSCGDFECEGDCRASSHEDYPRSFLPQPEVSRSFQSELPHRDRRNGPGHHGHWRGRLARPHLAVRCHDYRRRPIPHRASVANDVSRLLLSCRARKTRRARCNRPCALGPQR